MKNYLVIALASIAVLTQSLGQSTQTASTSDKQVVINNLSSQSAHYFDLAMQIWDLAELGYQEHQSSALLQNEMKSNGFTIEKGVADMPTAFIASYGSGQPVIALLGEFDALPGVSQSAEPVSYTHLTLPTKA